MRRCPWRVHVPVGAAAGGTNQAIGHRWHLLARASGPASCVPRINAALNEKREETRMVMLVDQVAREEAIRRCGLPECLHVPMAAVDEAAIVTYIGSIERILSKGSPNRALLVKVESPRAIDPIFPIAHMESAAILHSQMQVWVHIHYRGYRRAYKKAFPHEDIDRKVISHAKNRKIADLQGFQYVRITPINRGSNSSSAFSEQWGVDLHSTPTQMAANRSRGAFIHYGDLAAIMLMMDVKLGGGVMDVVNEGQKLVSPCR